MAPTVYIETTIPSYYFETRRTLRARAWRDATRRWWARHRHAFELPTSPFVLNELAAPPPRKASRCLGLLAGVKGLEFVDAVERAIEAYIANRLMPAVAGAIPALPTRCRPVRHATRMPTRSGPA